MCENFCCFQIKKGISNIAERRRENVESEHKKMISKYYLFVAPLSFQIHSKLSEIANSCHQSIIFNERGDLNASLTKLSYIFLQIFVLFDGFTFLSGRLSPKI